ncbi:hypothetical protein F5Y13DRAFT_176573 [Hypoxylon sp. FL1857]|nr:hypothetical protein F5Y13DRAFT_176573 [Hypoxylon sp. FL1857]
MATGPQAFYCLWQKEQIRETLFELLSNQDICNVRLASSACCNLVTKRLFLRTHLTFSAHTFTRQSRIEALSRVGQHIEHLTFYFPHSDATFLPPLIHPESGREISFLYKPHTSMASVLERPKFANSGLGEILTQQYPPLFHAASNVPHLTIKTPGQDPRERYRRDIVDYALISLRISLERAPLRKLTKLSLSAVHPSAFIYLRHAVGFGCLPSAARRWKQIRKLRISVESWNFYGPSPGLDHLKMIDDYIRDFSSNLEKLTFTWLGQKGPCPLSLAADPLFAPPRSSQKLFHEVTSPMSPLPPAPSRKPIVLKKVRYMALRNMTLNAPQVAAMVAAHQHIVREYDFENSVLINDDSWDDALAPLLNNKSRGGRWTRHSTATITEVASIHSQDPADDLSGDSPAVSAASQELLDLDLNGGEGETDGPPAQEDEQVEEFDLPSDLESARIASVSFPNKLKKRRITKRRRIKKPKHEHREEDEGKHRERHHRRQASNDSIDKPREEHHHRHRHRHQKTKEPLEEQPEAHHHSHSRQPSNSSLNRPQEPPQLSISPQSSRPRLFGEVDSVYSTSSRRLFGEVSQLSNSGSEPDLMHSPIDESDSLIDEYFRPSTPTTTPMDISAPILCTAPSMPVLLEPTVYDPTADLCSEITAVQRDIEAEEAQRRVAEDADVQTSALKRAKELVLSRLGSQFSSGGGGFGKRGGGGGGSGSGWGGGSGGGGAAGLRRKESFGAGSFLSSARFREGLFGKSTPVVSAFGYIWPHARPYVSGDDALTTRYMHATKGRPAWALVVDASGPMGRALCFELAARGFNVVLYSNSYGGAVARQQELLAVRDELLRAYPENKYRIVVADGNVEGGSRKCGVVGDFADRVATSLEDVNLTVVVNSMKNTGKSCEAEDADTALPVNLMAALMPLLRRNAPALVVNVAASPSAPGITETPLCSFCDVSKASSHDGVDVDVVPCCLGEVATNGRDAVLLIRPTPRALARAVLSHAGYSWSRGGSATAYPYLPDGLLQMMRDALPECAIDRLLALVGMEIEKDGIEGI